MTEQFDPSRPTKEGSRAPVSPQQLVERFLVRNAPATGGDARTRDLGAFAYIAKPFDPIALAAFIVSTLEPSRAEAVWA